MRRSTPGGREAGAGALGGRLGLLGHLLRHHGVGGVVRDAARLRLRAGQPMRSATNLLTARDLQAALPGCSPPETVGWAAHVLSGKLAGSQRLAGCAAKGMVSASREAARLMPGHCQSWSPCHLVHTPDPGGPPHMKHGCRPTAMHTPALKRCRNTLYLCMQPSHCKACTSCSCLGP